ncbi:MAG: hypothetical protein ACK4PR_01815, partial [Gammaproteobacteria bacterium]
MSKKLLTMGCCVLLNWNCAAFAEKETVSNPCSASASLFSLVDRPSKADSPCTVPMGYVMVETGYQYLDLIGGVNSQNFPQSMIRVGLPKNTEIFLFPPNYNIQTVSPSGGFSAMTVGLKHMFDYTDKWIFSAETLITPTSGSDAFGSGGTGVTVNGMASYAISNAVGATFMLGASSQTLSASSGSQRYNSINPDILLSWQLS